MNTCCVCVQGVALYDIDMDTAATQISVVRNYSSTDLFIACYISVGTWESYRVVRHAFVQLL